MRLFPPVVCEASRFARSLPATPCPPRETLPPHYSSGIKPSWTDNQDRIPKNAKNHRTEATVVTEDVLNRLSVVCCRALDPPQPRTLGPR